MFIYAFIHLHINILKPSQCLNSILSQLFCINFSTRIKSSQFTSHSTCFFRYTCIYIYMYIQYQINILKPLQCPQLQRAHTVVCVRYPPLPNWGVSLAPERTEIFRKCNWWLRPSRHGHSPYNTQRGMGGNGGAVAAQEYVMERKFVERYRKKISGSSQKIKLLVLSVFQYK